MDDISRAIGSLETEVRRTRDQLTQISAKLDTLASLPRRVHRLEPIVEDYARMRQRGIGLLLGASIAAGSVGAVLRDAIKWLHG